MDEKISEIFSSEGYKGCVIQHNCKNSVVYIPYQIDNELYVIYKVHVPVVELGYGPNDIKPILDYAIENCRDGQPISSSKTLEGAVRIIQHYVDSVHNGNKSMPFDFNLLKSGKPLKRKEWKGFWIWDDVKKTIMIHCANGEAIDIRMTDDVDFTLSNIFSMDWEIANENNSIVYKRYMESKNKDNYKVIGYNYNAFDKIKCPVCGGDINMEYDLYNGVQYDRDCKCVIRIEDYHSINVEIRQYLDDCQLDK